MLKTSFSKKIELSVRESLNRFRTIISYRNDRLFTEFLPHGYRYTTLTSVDHEYYEQAIIAKFHLGMLITLLDDFADHPEYVNSILLNELYKVPFTSEHLKLKHLSEKELSILHLAEYLCQQILDHIQHLPHFEQFQELFKFDFLRFYQANHFAELIGKHTEMINSYELQQLRPFNMGMVIAGMIDVFASTHFNMHELGKARHLFHLAQRYGSICNNLNTFSREWLEADITNEITVKGALLQIIEPADIGNMPFQLACQKLKSIIDQLREEQQKILTTILQEKNKIQSFNCDEYAAGLKQLKKLHENLQGVI